jgi:hypothetical protein
MTFIFLGRVACESCEFVTTSLAFTLKANPDAKPPLVDNSFRRVIFILLAYPLTKNMGTAEHFRGSKSRYHTEKEGPITTRNSLRSIAQQHLISIRLDAVVIHLGPRGRFSCTRLFQLVWIRGCNAQAGPVWVLLLLSIHDHCIWFDFAIRMERCFAVNAARRFASFSCPVRIHHVSFVLDQPESGSI